MAKPHPAAPDWLMLPPEQQQLETGWVGYRHVSGAMHWHHAASEENRLSAAIVLPTPTDDDSGITHALEHMVLRGSARYPEPDTFLSLRTELALLEFNATTQKESTRFHLTGYDPTSVLRGIGFMADCVFSPQLTDADFDDEIVRSDGDGALYRELCEYLRRDSFQAAITQAAMSEPRAPLFGGMPETVTHLDIHALRRYHNHYYRPESMVLLTAGSWPMVALWQQLSKSLDNVGEPLPMPVPELSLHAELRGEGGAEIVTLPLAPHWAAALYPTLIAGRCQQTLAEMGATLLPLFTDFQPVPTLRFRLEQGADRDGLHGYVEALASKMPSRRVNWQSGYFSLQQGQNMVRRWGDGLQRLYHDFSVTPFAPSFLKGDQRAPQFSDSTLTVSNAEWLSPCKPLTRLAILCRCNARDSASQQALERWLGLCQQRTLRWAWMQGNPVLGGFGKWDCANVRVLAYTVDLPLEQVDALRDFWHHHLSIDEVRALDGEWQRTANGMEFYLAGSTPVFRAGTIMASHKDEASAMHVTLSFPHTVDAGEIATFGQAVMAQSLVKKRRLGGRCYSFAVSIDLMSYELTFDTVADSDPSVSFIALLNAMEALTKPLENNELEKRCQGGMGLVSSRYGKAHARFHAALLGTVGQSLAVDFTAVSSDGLAELAVQVLSALKHPTVH